MCYLCFVLSAESSLGSSSVGGAQSSSSSTSASSSAMGSVSKKAKKEAPADSGCGSPETESELPLEDDSKYPEDLEDRIKGGGQDQFTYCVFLFVIVVQLLNGLDGVPAVFNNPRVQGKKTVLEKLGEVVDILKKGVSAPDQTQELAAVLFLTRLLEEKGAQEKNSMRSDSAQTIR